MLGVLVVGSGVCLPDVDAVVGSFDGQEAC